MCDCDCMCVCLDVFVLVLNGTKIASNQINANAGEVFLWKKIIIAYILQGRQYGVGMLVGFMLILYF